jgi:hypothetical protein
MGSALSSNEIVLIAANAGRLKVVQGELIPVESHDGQIDDNC